MKRVVVTGGSGKAGQATLVELADHGYDVLNVDTVAPAGVAAKFPCKIADLAEMGEARAVLDDAEAVVHLGAIPNEMMHTGPRVFHNNTLSTYNVFESARQSGLQRVVWASSETLLGLSFADEPPRYAPVDDDHAPYPNSSYSLSKVMGEAMADQYARWSGVAHVGLRFTNIFRPEDYENVPSFWADARLRSWNLWGYVDTRDVARSCRCGLEADVSGSANVIIAAADTIMNRPSAELMAEVFPDVPIRKSLGEFETLLAIDLARELIGYQPAHSWRDEISG